EHSERGVALGEAQHVGHQLLDVPVVVHRLLRPVVRPELADGVGEALVLGLGQPHALGMADRPDVLHPHCCRVHLRLFLLLGFLTWSRNMSTTSSTRRVHRLPPGSLAICWNEIPEISPVQRSKYSGPMPPRAIRS